MVPTMMTCLIMTFIINSKNSGVKLPHPPRYYRHETVKKSFLPFRFLIVAQGNGRVKEKTMKYELMPNDCHKSFYGKAIVERDENGNETLYSYGTKIITRTAEGELIKHWFGYTATTQRHIAAFCGLNKKEYEEL